MTPYPTLNFPEYEFSIKQQNGQLFIFDIIRRKMVALTPEEWVRQHLIHYLVKQKKYSPSLLQVEYGLTISGKSFRIDVAAFSKEAKPLLLCECKAPTITLNTKTIGQASLYNQHQHAPYLLITNGISHYCMHFDGNQWIFLKEIPTFDEIV